MYKLVLVFFKSVANNQATIWWLFLQQVHKLQQVQIPTSQPEIEKNPWSQRQSRIRIETSYRHIRHQQHQ